MPKFSKFFRLCRSQPELDFVDIELETDMALFVDPFAISQRVDPWARAARDTLVDFFQRTITAIREGRDGKARQLLSNLGEPNETHLGLSRGRSRGAGLGKVQTGLLYRALQESSAVRTGLLTALEECELMVDGVSCDKLSDLTTNIIRGHLIEYTQGQCALHGVPTATLPVRPQYDADEGAWRSEYAALPVDNVGHPILLVPKSVVRCSPAYDHRAFYAKYELEYLQAEHLQANTSLVQTLKSGRRRVTKKDLRAVYPCTRAAIANFIKENPDTLRQYRDDLTRIEKRKPYEIVGEQDVAVLAGALGDALKVLPSGSAHASQYHSLMIGILELLFFPSLTNPTKEVGIHQDRKRIDIVMENGAKEGVFWRLREISHIPCSYVLIECKNYRGDIANPEIDQLSGRFSPTRGKVGILCCRSFRDRPRFVERCKDTFRDRRGLIVLLDDERVLHMLDLMRRGKREEACAAFRTMVADIERS